jgi:DHA1 family bicyclomycin/chloramphenicol resistance-like MFS transporter
MMVKPDPRGAIVTTLLVLMVATGPISTDLYLPALPGLQSYFGANAATIQLTLSVYLGAFAVSQLIYGPLSDRFGRRAVVAVGMGLYTLASLACTLAPTIEWLIAARFVQALGGCSGGVIARAVVRDVHGADGAGKVLAKIAAAMGLAPMVGPVLGGFLTDHFGWQACFVVLVCAGCVSLLGALFVLQETNQQLDSTALSPRQMTRNIGKLLRDPVYMGYALTASSSYAGAFAFISGSSFVFIEILGVSVQGFGFCFSAGVVGYIIGARIAGYLPGGPRTIGWGALLNVTFGLAMLIPVLMGIETVATVLIPMVLFMIGMGIILPHAQAGAVGPYPRMAGTASALFGTMQYSVAALLGIAVGQGFSIAGGVTPLPMAIGIAGSGLLTFLCYLTLLRPILRRNPGQE